jgi:hypothetical protein
MPNYDEKTGIHYGVISPNALNQDALNDLYTEGTDPHYQDGLKELLSDIEALCDNHGIHFGRVDTGSFVDEYTDHYEGCGDGQCDYEDKEYTLHISGDNFGIFVIRSPYYTYCRQCSPCAPNAGDLNNPIDISDMEVSPYKSKTYCLDSSFFDEYNPIPYKVYRVDNDQEVV